MILVIDCFKLVRGLGKSLGIYNVAENLVRGLAAEKKRTRDDTIKNCEIIVLGNSQNRKDFECEGVTFRQIDNYKPENKLHCLIWELFEVSKVCRKLNADKVIFPRGFCAIRHPVFDIVIIHDMIPFFYDEKYPGVLNRLENAYIMARLKASAKTAKKVLTISEASKADIIKYCGIQESKITVIYNTVDEMDASHALVYASKNHLPVIYNTVDEMDAPCDADCLNQTGQVPENAASGGLHNTDADSYRDIQNHDKDASDKACCKNKNSLLNDIDNAPYICAITSELPHKNARGILKAYEEYCKMTDDPMKLVIVGIEDALSFGISSETAAHIICYKRILDKNELNGVIKNSFVFLFLSLKEGFGLPVIEAMQAGVPVICSNISSMPEVAGKAAVLVDPENGRKAGEAILRIEKDEEFRQNLIEKGRQNITRFSQNTRAKLYWEEILKK